MGAFLMLGLLGLLGAMDFSSSTSVETAAQDEDGSQGDDPINLTGIVGEDDILTGGDGDDTLTGNLDDPDVLDGQGGDDLLIVQNNNTATGGTGNDTFDITNGEKSTITDFDPEEDALQVLFLNNTDVPKTEEALHWTVTEEGVELHAADQVGAKQSGATHLVTLLGLTEPPEDTVILFTPIG